MSLLLFIELLAIILGLGRKMELRWTVTFDDPNQMAHFVIWAVLIGLVGGWYLQRSLQFSWFISLIGMLLLVFSASRSGLLGTSWIFVTLCIVILVAIHRNLSKKRVLKQSIKDNGCGKPVDGNGWFILPL